MIIVMVWYSLKRREGKVKWNTKDQKHKKHRIITNYQLRDTDSIKNYE